MLFCFRDSCNQLLSIIGWHWSSRSPPWGSPRLGAAPWAAGCQRGDSPRCSTSGSVGRSESGSPCRGRTAASGSGRPTPGTGPRAVWPGGWAGCGTTAGLVTSLTYIISECSVCISRIYKVLSLSEDEGCLFFRTSTAVLKIYESSWRPTDKPQLSLSGTGNTSRCLAFYVFIKRTAIFTVAEKSKECYLG